MSITSPSALLAVVALCHFGHHDDVPGADPTPADFLEASVRGLVVIHPEWRATERGIAVLIGAKLLPGEPLPRPAVVVHALWCVDQHGEPGFLTAFPDDFVKDCPAHYEDARREAETKFLTGLDPRDRSAVRFFTTETALPLPPVPAFLDVQPATVSPPPPAPAPSSLDTELARSVPA